MMTRLTPFSSQPSMVAMSRMPPPSCTHMPTAFQDALDRRRIHRLAGKGAVEIDDVQMLEALLSRTHAPARRIAIEHGRARHVALLQPHRERLP